MLITFEESSERESEERESRRADEQTSRGAENDHEKSKRGSVEERQSVIGK
jgi:hypothetical protein